VGNYTRMYGIYVTRVLVRDLSLDREPERTLFSCVLFFVDGWPESAGGGNEYVKRFFFM